MADKLASAPEIVGAMVGNLNDAELAEFFANADGFMQKLGIEAGFKLNPVQNTASIVNLALPYYSGLERNAGAILDDAELEAASGGDGVVSNAGAVYIGYQNRIVDMQEVDLDAINAAAKLAEANAPRGTPDPNKPENQPQGK